MNKSPNEQLLALSHEMLVCAEAGNWDKLAELEQSRLSIFQKVFAKGIADNIELAREILAIDKKTMSLASAKLPALQQEVLDMHQSGIASNAYQAIQNSTSSVD